MTTGCGQAAIKLWLGLKKERQKLVFVSFAKQMQLKWLQGPVLGPFVFLQTVKKLSGKGQRPWITKHQFTCRLCGKGLFFQHTKRSSTKQQRLCDTSVKLPVKGTWEAHSEHPHREHKKSFYKKPHILYGHFHYLFYRVQKEKINTLGQFTYLFFKRQNTHSKKVCFSSTSMA